MTENMKKFLELASQNEELCARVSAAAKDELIAIAKELGIDLTDEDFAQPSSELSDDELDTISGGSHIDCLCVMGGGGDKDNNDKTCACVVAGAGFTKTGKSRCACPLSGYGYDT